LRAGDRVVYWAVGSGRVLRDGEARFFALARVMSERLQRNPQVRLTDPQGEKAERLLPAVAPERLAQLVEPEVPPERRSL
jgi:hypothetical protein